MQFVALFFEIIILSFGVYIYLFSIGKLKVKDPKLNEKAEEFRTGNSTWMKWMSLLLIAIMTIEIIFNVKSLF